MLPVTGDFLKILTHNLGFPRIGPRRELKKALEAYWNGRCSEADLMASTRAIRRGNWLVQKAAGIDLVPSNDFSLYDHVLDTAVMAGVLPRRFHPDGGPVD